MPFVQVQVIEGVFSEKQKEEMITRLTEAVVSVEGEALRPYTVVAIDEVRSGDWAVGGRILTTDAVHAMAKAGQHAVAR